MWERGRNIDRQYHPYYCLKLLLKHPKKMRQTFPVFCSSWLVIELPNFNQCTTRQSGSRPVLISECKPKRMHKQFIEWEKQRAACGERCPERHQHVGCGQPMMVPANYDVSCHRSGLLLALSFVGELQQLLAGSHQQARSDWVKASSYATVRLCSCP